MTEVNYSSPYVKAIGWGLLVGGLACVGIEVAMAWLQADVTAATESGKVVNKVSAITIAVVGVVIIGFAAGACRADKKLGWARGLTLVMLASAIASINNMASFQATERMSASKSREAEIGRQKAADTLAKQSAEKVLTFAGRAKSSSARQDFIDANADAVRAFREAKVEVKVEPDAGAQLWATISGWSLDTIQMIQSAYISILVIILGMVCFQGAGFFLNPLAWVKAGSVSSSPKGGSGDTGSGVKSTEESKPKQDGNVVPIRASEAQDASISASPKVSAAPPRVPAPAPSLPVPLALKPTYASVEDFLEIHPHVTNQTVIVKETGFSPAKVSRDIKRLKGRGKVKVEKKWRSNAITLTPRRNGGVLHAVI